MTQAELGNDLIAIGAFCLVSSWLAFFALGVCYEKWKRERL
jgi:hypothetical protein